MRLSRSFLIAAFMSFSLPSLAYGFQTVYLTRHAEKADSGKDPDLSPKGKERAQALSQALRDADITAIFTTEYKRTKQTAAPTAALFKLEPQASNDLEKTLKAIKDDKTDKAALVIGHSNTLQDVLKALGSEVKADVKETEFDRLYIISLAKDQKPIVHLIRYN